MQTETDTKNHFHGSNNLFRMQNCFNHIQFVFHYSLYIECTYSSLIDQSCERVWQSSIILRLSWVDIKSISSLWVYEISSPLVYLSICHLIKNAVYTLKDITNVVDIDEICKVKLIVSGWLRRWKPGSSLFSWLKKILQAK